MDSKICAGGDNRAELGGNGWAKAGLGMQKGFLCKVQNR